MENTPGMIIISVGTQTNEDITKMSFEGLKCLNRELWDLLSRIK